MFCCESDYQGFASDGSELSMNFEAWNRYILGAIGLLAVLFYVVVVFSGFTELISRKPKHSPRRKRCRTRDNARRLPNTRKSS